MTSKTKLFLILSVLVSVALACSLTPQATPAPSDPGAVDTMVAQTVAASNPQVPPADNGSQGDGGNPPPAASNTPEPPPPTNTPEPTDTPEPTNTPEPPPSAIDALNLGSPDATYKFDSKGTFYTYDQSDSKVEIKDGALQFTIKKAISWSIWSFSSIEIKDYYFEINVRMPDDCVGYDRGGIIFGTAPGDTDYGYNYQVSCNGRYRLFIYDGNATINLINWSDSGEIKEGPGKVNRLGVLHKDNKISLYMNGIKLDTVTDNTYVGKGRIGVNMGSDEHDNVTIFFDDAAYWTTLP